VMERRYFGTAYDMQSEFQAAQAPAQR
jgi:hypothetical protein